VLPDDDERSRVVSALRDSCFSVDAFATQRKAREIVANELTRAEDRLELAAIDAGRRGSIGERLTARRLAIRAIRRRLEWELWS
jgi:hypothetical protein